MINNSFLANVTALLFVLYVAVATRNLIVLFFVTIWCRRKKWRYNTPVDDRERVCILIPVVYEQKIIRETVQHFANHVKCFPHCEVVFVTTEREEVFDGSTTKDLISAEIRDNKFSQISICHYPLRSGVMSHQLNYAVRKLRETHGEGRFWLAIYNADSRLTKRSFHDILCHMGPRRNTTDCIYQQVSCYRIPRNISPRSLSASDALWQTRWSLTFELPRMVFQLAIARIFQSRQMRDHERMPMFSYCLGLLLEKMIYLVGHGLILRTDTLERLGGFPEDTINEDAFLGYIANNERIPIVPIPAFESCDVPGTTSVLVRQQSVWFNGPADAFQYVRLYSSGANTAHPTRPRCNFDARSKIRAFVLGMKLFLHAVYWVVSPMLLMICLPVMAALSWGTIAAAYTFALWVLYLPLTHFVTKKVAYHLGFPQRAQPSTFCFLLFVVHGLGASINIFKRLTRKNEVSRKYKTERTSA